MSMQMKVWRRLLAGCLTAAALFAAAAAEELPYSSYIYDRDGSTLASPASWAPTAVIDGKSLGTTALREPADLVRTANGSLWLLDAGNGRLLRLDASLRLVQELSVFTFNGREETLSDPGGMTVLRDGTLYVADTGHNRILRMEADGTIRQIIGRPDSPLFEEDFVFKPNKVAVDRAGRIFVVAEGVNQGLMEFDSDGHFANFLGAPRVTYSAVEYLWKMISTDAQRRRSDKFVPTEYSNVIVDGEGFLYATISTADAEAQQKAAASDDRSSEVPVRRMNAMGDDILIKNGITAPWGDLVYDNKNGTIQGPSAMIDVTVTENGIYSLLDNRRGRIFSYDAEGELLDVFGGLGSQVGTFVQPCALERLGNRMLVLDRSLGALTVFTQTDHGACLEEAIRLYDSGRYEESVEQWRTVLRYNSNYLPAYTGIGKSLYRQDEYAEAYRYFELSGDRDYLSRSFRYTRDELLYRYIGWIFAAAVLIAAAAAALGVRSRRRRAAGIVTEKYPPTLWGDVRFSFFVIFHPFRGFWDVKHERRPRLTLTVLFLFGLLFSFVGKSLYTGELFGRADEASYALINDVSTTLIPFFLWCVASWCFTSLMDGEGTMRDVVIATTYSIVPLLLITLPLALSSNLLSLDEAIFYHFFHSLATIWTVALIVIGTMVTHQYSVSKTILTCILSVLGMGVMIFLALVMYSVIQQVGGFVFGIIRELSFRF